jgi:hypothetical protein
LILSRLQILDQGVETGFDAAPAREGEQLIAHLAAAVRCRKELARLGLQRQWDSSVLLEEAALLGQRPGAEDFS